MGRINILKQEISSKIAAGEVIERPVSVVKELVENSIDANSKNIVIEIKVGGKKSIKIIDDGVGIARDDVKLAFERHATSKIYSLYDIYNIKTLGFRGEALASIASVSEIELLTKTKDESVGTKCSIKGGVVEEIHDAPSNNGCCIEVNNLFYNTPARLKFLRSNVKEASLITDFVTKLAIGNPDISFRLKIDDKETFYSSGNNDIREVIAKVYGIDVAKQMISIEKTFEHGSIEGCISPPQYNRGNRSGELFFVNQRFIKDKNLTFAVERGYKTLLPIGRFPITIIFINVEPSQIDINVHPSKTEVKFQEDNKIFNAVYSSVKQGLDQNVLIPKEKITNPFIQAVNFEKQVELESKPDADMVVQNEYSFNFNNETEKVPETQAGFVFEKKQELSVFEPKTSASKKFDYYKILGQLFDTYIVVQGQDDFYLVDQHAAHERILFETFLDKFSKQPNSQNLIVPYTMNLSVQEFSILEIFIEDLRKIGFDISIFGKDSIIVRAVPYFFNKATDPEVIRIVLDQLKSDESTGLSSKEKFIASMACHTAIKAGDVLSNIEINELLTKLKGINNPYTCPHGRPTIISFSLKELEKKFKRIL